MNKFLGAICIVIVITGLVGLYVVYDKGGELSILEENVQIYVTEHISELSPVKEQLGGKFYITAIEAKDGKGIVSYEDGHNAYMADFAYQLVDGQITILSFTVRSY